MLKSAELTVLPMNSMLPWLLLLTVIVIVFLVTFLMLLLSLNRKLNHLARAMTLPDSQQLAQEKLLDKVITMLGTKDPLAFSQVQSVNFEQPQMWLDPSDEAEAKRMEATHDGSPISYEEDDYTVPDGIPNRADFIREIFESVP